MPAVLHCRMKSGDICGKGELNQFKPFVSKENFVSA